MFRKPILYGLLLGVAGSAPNAESLDWKRVGPPGGTSSFLTADPANPAHLWTGVDRQLFQTHDGGASWTVVASAPAGVHLLVYDPFQTTKIYAAVAPRTLFGIGDEFWTSRDNGSVWERVSLSHTSDSPGFVSLYPDPAASGVLFAGIAFDDLSSGRRDYHVWRSVDGGRNWVNMDEGLPTYQVYPSGSEVSVVADGRHKVPPRPSYPSANAFYRDSQRNMLYVATNLGVFKSNDNLTWQPASSGMADLSVWDIAGSPQSGTTLYALTPSSVYKTSGGTDQWTSTGPHTGSNFRPMAMDAKNPSRLAVLGKITDNQTTRTVPFASTDSGQNWSATASSLPFGDAWSLEFSLDGSGLLYAATIDFGVFVSRNLGQSWDAINLGLPPMQSRDIAQSPSSLRIFGLFGGLVYFSDDQGTSWSKLSSSLDTLAPINRVIPDPSHPDLLYLLNNSGLSKYVIGDKDWTFLKAGLSKIAVAPSNPRTLYGGEFSNGGVFTLFRSDDAGESWITLPGNDLQGGFFLSAQIVVDPRNSEWLYVDARMNIYKSIDGGNSWAKLSLPFPQTGFVLDPLSPDTLYVSSYGNGFFKSTNGGRSWVVANDGLTDLFLQCLAVDPSHPQTLFAATTSDIAMTADKGTHWVMLDGPLDETDGGMFGPSRTEKLLLVNSGNYQIFELIAGELWTSSVAPLAMVSPSGGEIWMSGSLVPIEWVAPRLDENLRLEYSADGGLNFNPIATVPAGQSVYQWKVPDDNSNSYLIRMTAVNSGHSVSSQPLTVINNCSFKLQPGSVTIDANGGDGQIQVDCQAGCLWQASSNSSWIVLANSSTGQGAGTVSFTVTANSNSQARQGQIEVGGQGFTVSQSGGSSCHYQLAERSSVVYSGSDDVGSVSITCGSECTWAARSSDSWIRIDSSDSHGTGDGSIPFNMDVNLGPSPRTGEIQIGELSYVVTQLPWNFKQFVPAVLSLHGAKGSFYKTQLTLSTSGRSGSKAADVELHYVSATTANKGVATLMLEPGTQLIIPDVVSFLASQGIFVSDPENELGTLEIDLIGCTAWPSVVARTTTAVGTLGRAGVAYEAVTAAEAFNDTAYVFGLRQNDVDRSNLALQNVGSPPSDPIRLRVTIYDGSTAAAFPLPEFDLSPGGFIQINEILQSYGLSLSEGYARVERITGSAPFYAYGVINDQVTSDGSFVTPLAEESSPSNLLLVPSIVKTARYSSELMLANWSSAGKRLQLQYVESQQEAVLSPVSVELDLKAGEQKLIPDLLDFLRQHGQGGSGLAGAEHTGVLLISAIEGNCQHVFVGARTSTVGLDGHYGVYYSAIPAEQFLTDTAWIYGLQQDEENRSNLALVNTGTTDASANVFDLEVRDETGAVTNTITGVTVPAGGWLQLNSLFTTYAPQVRQGYVRITRTTGNNPFVAYGVINDGAQPGQRTGDGAFVASSP